MPACFMQHHVRTILVLHRKNFFLIKTSLIKLLAGFRGSFLRGAKLESWVLKMTRIAKFGIIKRRRLLESQPWIQTSMVSL